MRPLKILMLSNMCPPDFEGGFELRAFQIAGALRERGHEVDLATSFFRPTFSGVRENPPWVHRIFDFVAMSQSRSLWRYVDRIPRRIACSSIASKNIPALERFLANRTYDVAYVFGLQRISLAVMIPLMERQVPILWHAGDNYIADHFYHWPKTLPGYSLGLNLFAKKWYDLEKSVDYGSVAFVSEYLRDEAAEKGFHPKTSFIIPRGFDGSLSSDVDRPRANPPLFFMACRLDPEKGIHHAIEAAILLLARRPDLDWRLEIAGKSYSGYQDQMKSLVEKHGLSDKIFFLGQVPRSDVLTKMKEATAFLSCSAYGEPFAGTIIETLATGTLLIGSRAGSILEVVVPDKSALIYEIGDTTVLSRHMETALTDPDLRHRVALEGVKVVAERYTLNKILAQTEATFEAVIENHPRSSKKFAPV